MRTPAKTMTHWQWLALLLLSVLWGGSFFFNGIAIRELPALSIVWLRVALAAAVLLLVTKAMQLPMPGHRAALSAYWRMGLLNNVIPFSLIVWGQGHITSGLAAILNATTPLFTVLMAHLLTQDERLTGAKLLGVLVGFAGVVAMFAQGGLADIGIGGVAQVAVLAAAASYGVAGIFGRRFARMGIPPMAAATGQLCASSLILAPIVLFVDRPWTLNMPASGTAAAIVALAVLSTALAYFIYFRILATSGATNLLLVTFLIPVSAVTLGIGFLDEALQMRHVVGMAGIVVGLLVIDGRILSRARPNNGVRSRSG